MVKIDGEIEIFENSFNPNQLLIKVTINHLDKTKTINEIIIDTSKASAEQIKSLCDKIDYLQLNLV